MLTLSSYCWCWHVIVVLCNADVSSSVHSQNSLRARERPERVPAYFTIADKHTLILLSICLCIYIASIFLGKAVQLYASGLSYATDGNCGDNSPPHFP